MTSFKVRRSVNARGAFTTIGAVRSRAVQICRVAVPVLVALLILSLGKDGHLWPWQPATVDLEVYRHAVQVWLHGGDPLSDPVAGPQPLVFTYPPFALLVLLPLVIVPWTLLQALWTTASVLVLYRVVAARLGGWWPCLVTAGLIVACQPVRMTLLLGQINLLLLGLIAYDLSSRRSRMRGALTGLATAVKMTPGVFAVLLAGAREWRALRNLLLVALACSAIALAVLPDETFGFARSLTGGDTRAGNLEGQVNQSLLAAWVRMGGPYPIGIGLAAFAGVAGALVAARWYAVRPALAVALAAVAGLLASPISWDHHFVWVVPLGLALLDREIPRRIRIIGYAFAGWMGAGLYRTGSPLRGEGRLEFEPWQVLLGAIGPGLAIALLVAAATCTLPTRPAPGYGRLPG